MNYLSENVFYYILYFILKLFSSSLFLSLSLFFFKCFSQFS